MSITIRIRKDGGSWEQYEIDSLVFGPEPPDPTPPYPNPPVYATDREQFMAWVDGKPFGQQTVLDLFPGSESRPKEIVTNSYGWQLTTENANHERTKVRPPNGPWVRVGFGEGTWQWILQP